MTYPVWLPDHLRLFWDADDLSLFRTLIVGEAQGEGYTGQLAVAYAAANRKRFAAMSRLPWFHPNSHRENILAKYQFSCFWADWPKRRGAMELALVYASRYYLADVAARACLDETQPDPTLGADHYFAPDSCPTPAWAKPLIDERGHLVRPGFTRTVRIGGHEFFSSWAP